MSRVRIAVLGPLTVSGSQLNQPRLSKSVRRLVALVAAAGPDGIDRDELAVELWGSPLPESWKSAIRNRMTAARKVLGVDTVLNQSGRFVFGSNVTVDSWELIAHEVDQLGDGINKIGFLDGEALAGIETSPLIASHRQRIADARSAILRDTVATAGGSLSPLELQTLRAYQRLHRLDATVTRATIRAHIATGETNQAREIADDVRAFATEPLLKVNAWVDRLEELFETAHGHRRRADDHGTQDDANEIRIRAELFESAANDENWSVALEIATAGLPEAERAEGDPERLKLLEAIPVDKLDPSHRFRFCVTLACHLMYAGREHEAREWSVATHSMAETPDDKLLAYITTAIVGDVVDERTPIPLPTDFATAPDETINMQSLQVAVMSHLERSSFEDAAWLKHRFDGLVEASADPYRRWHMLLLENMTRFVDGDFESAAVVATRAHRYAKFFNINEADLVLFCQRSNGHWVNPGFNANTDTAGEFGESSDATIVRALRAATLAHDDDGQAVHEFMRTFDWESSGYFTFSTLIVVARHVRDPDLRHRVATRLKKRAGTSAIWGTGVLHLGPVDRTLAHLVDDRDDRELHIAAAVNVADRQRTRLWQVVCRLDLAAATGNDQHRVAAEALATTPALEQLIQEYSAALR